jgi:hypothetical protein
MELSRISINYLETAPGAHADKKFAEGGKVGEN